MSRTPTWSSSSLVALRECSITPLRCFLFLFLQYMDNDEQDWRDSAER
jgi:hypothetical protein